MNQKIASVLIESNDSPASCPDWQHELNTLVTSVDELFKQLEINVLRFEPSMLERLQAPVGDFPIRVTHSYIKRMEKGNINDPLLKQVLPSEMEMDDIAGYISDPLGESERNPIPGLLHKYKSRALLIAASQCAVNCRYCFRRHFSYSDNHANKHAWLKALEYIGRRTEINEVILSGGDPLVVNDKALSWLVDQVAKIPHITRLRIHSRLPIVLPSRITSELIDLLSSSRLSVVLVTHANHPNEIDNEVKEKVQQLKNAGVTVLNQAVLLKTINDDVATQVALSEKIFWAGALPYYLFVLDKVKGAAHFDISEKQAISIYRGMLKELPGFLVPKFAREVSGELSKTPINIEY